MALLVLLLLAPSAGLAVALGEARVKSFLNQPLDVEIELVGVAPGEDQDLRLRIANDEHFDRLGIQYTHLLRDLQFDVVGSGQRWLVRVRSRRPINEPFLDFPLQLNWRGGQLIKQYTLLLDPPRSINVAARSAAPTTPQRRAAPQPAQPAAASGSDYGPVRRGETLWPIAQQVKPAGVTTQQMAMALLRANPQAFIDNNINQLREGAVLAVPPRAFIDELDAAAARTAFNRAASQRAGRAAPASPVLATPPPRPAAAEPAEPVTPAEPSEPQPAPPAAVEEEAQLRIVADDDKRKAEPGSEADLREKLLVTMEEIESNRLTTDAIESRVAKLESELERMQKLLDLKDAQIEALQSEVTTRDELQRASELAEPTLPPATAADVTPSDSTGAPAASATTGVIEVPQAPTVDSGVSAPVADRESGIVRWYREYLWLLWAALALLGIAALMLMFRRPQAVDDGDEETEAELVAAAPVAVAASAQPELEEELREAEADLRAVADAHLPEDEKSLDDDLEDLELPDIDIENLAELDIENAPHSDISDSLLADMLDESKLVSDSTDPASADFNDDDIASWIRELGSDGKAQDAEVAAVPRSTPDNDDLPSLLTELDDQLTISDAPELVDPLQEPPSAPGHEDEDDTFSMSLDLARAYLEIGDQEGARDMLQQALAGARDPDHRRQIEELLQQIG
ncbi:MAG: hypothetical protein KDI82_04155 [Gammaproteobacteria bacterium]|nr:hypothetical protein [Gammaproteobacteria bacterium]